MRRIGSILSVFVGISALPAYSQTIALSGTVKDSVTGNGLFGAKVSLAMAKDSTTTSSDGSWSLVRSSPTGVGLRASSSRAVSGHLSLQDGHVVLRFDGHDLLGHSQPGASAATASAAALARSSGSVVDTLLVSWKDSIRVRYPLTSYSATGLQLAFDTSSIVLDTGHFTDARDGQSYKYTKIGLQTWMAQNLNYKRSGSDSGLCYNGSTDSCSKYGRMYTWSEAMDTTFQYNSVPLNATLPRQGICPIGWHVPSDSEWHVLITSQMDSATSGTELKSTDGWYNNARSARDSGGTDTYDFRILPAPSRDNNGMIHANTGDGVAFWSSSESTGILVWYRYFGYQVAGVVRSVGSKSSGFSLRCIQDSTTVGLP